jgi:Nrap protein PAP/OAS1-like domain 5
VQGLALKAPARDVTVTPAGVAAIRQRAAMQHHGLVAAALGEHPCAGEACRLAKRWVASQMLSYHVPEELTELIVVAVYTGCALLQSWLRSWLRSSSRSLLLAALICLAELPHLHRPLRLLLQHVKRVRTRAWPMHVAGMSCRSIHPQPRPASPLAGFCRYLQLLATHNWRHEALTVGSAGGNALLAQPAPLKTPSAAAGCACRVVTPYDAQGQIWTAEQPSQEMLARVELLAADAFDKLSAALRHKSFVPRCVCTRLQVVTGLKTMH